MNNNNEKVESKLAHLIDDILAGLIILGPVFLFGYVLTKLYWFIWDKSEIFLFYVSNEQIAKNPEFWHLVAAIGMFLFLWFLGRTRDIKLFGKTLDQWLDKLGSKIPVLGFVYGLFNKALESFKKDKTKKSTRQKGKVVIIPSSGNPAFMQIGNITNDHPVKVYNYYFREVLPHYAVNFQPAFNVAGGSAYLVPEKIITICDEHAILNISAEDAYQFNVTGGRIIPGALELPKTSY